MRRLLMLLPAMVLLTVWTTTLASAEPEAGSTEGGAGNCATKIDPGPTDSPADDTSQTVCYPSGTAGRAAFRSAIGAPAATGDYPTDADRLYYSHFPGDTTYPPLPSGSTTASATTAAASTSPSYLIYAMFQYFDFRGDYRLVYWPDTRPCGEAITSFAGDAFDNKTSSARTYSCGAQFWQYSNCQGMMVHVPPNVNYPQFPADMDNKTSCVKGQSK